MINIEVCTTSRVSTAEDQLIGEMMRGLMALLIRWTPESERIWIALVKQTAERINACGGDGNYAHRLADMIRII